MDKRLKELKYRKGNVIKRCFSCFWCNPKNECCYKFFKKENGKDIDMIPINITYVCNAYDRDD